jgi:pimeloyl-ACP methyl ester carboxylesterase
MKRSTVRGLFALVTGALVFPVFAVEAQTQAPAQTIALRRADGAAVPLRIYPARGAAACAPAMIISHGLGGSETTLGGLAGTMAARGWRVLVMGHAESGRDQLRAAFRGGNGLAGVDAAARARPLHAARFADLDAAYGEATRICRPPSLILAGHSMGAQTTMMEAGAVPLTGRMGQNRFDAYIALSPQGIGTAFGPGAWAGVSKPVLMITGTNDRVVGGDYTARLSAFAGLPPGAKRLAVIPGAGHLQIGGVGSAGVTATVNALAAEFAGQAARGTWAASSVAGVAVTDK